MSAGLSEQRLKGQASQGKNVEERSIPWSQQVDEAFFDISSPAEVNLQGTVATGTQFQYPPFNSKESHSAIDSYQSENTRRNSQQGEANQSSLNYYSRKYENDNSVTSKQHISGNQNFNKRTSNHDDTYRSIKSNLAHRTNNDTPKLNIQRGLQTLSLDNVEKTNKNSTITSVDQSNNSKNNNKNNATEHQTTIAAKQMTWASIASQPAKPILRSNLVSSTLKKKGPGMPPPPMVPGKHNMDINTWDTPKNGPTLVPPPLPPVIPVPILEQSIFNQNKVNSAEEKNGGGNNSENGVQKQKSGQENCEQLENPNSNNNWTATCQLQNKLPERNNQQHSSTKTISNENNVRPPWVPQYQQQQHSHHSSQNQSSSYYQVNSRNFNTTHQIRGLDSGNIHYNRHDSSANNQFANSSQVDPPITSSPTPSNTSSIAIDVHQEQRQNNYNPRELDIKKANLARFFVIKSYSEDDIYRSIKYEIWCSTDRGNRRLDDAFQERQRERGFLYLLFSVNGSGHFCGIAQMMTPVDYNSVSNVWSQKKWKGTFKVKWLYVKDVPNHLFKWITIETNENKPVTNSRDTQEVPNDKGILVMKIIHEYKHTTSLFDDFWHYRKRQEEEKVIKKHDIPTNVSGTSGNRSQHRSGGGDFNRGENYDNKNSYHRERRTYNRGSYQNNYENRRGNDNCRNTQDSCTSLTNHNNNRDNGGDSYNSRNSGFRNNYRRDDRNDDNSLNCVESRGIQGNFPHRSDNRGLGGSFRERDRDSYKRKGAWRSTQRSVEINEKADN